MRKVKFHGKIKRDKTLMRTIANNYHYCLEKKKIDTADCIFYCQQKALVFRNYCDSQSSTKNSVFNINVLIRDADLLPVELLPT